MAIPNKPVTRKETYLASIAGQSVDLPDAPVTREEQYLEYIAKNGSGSGGGGSVTVDSALSSTSTNPVQNKAIFNALSGYATTAQLDAKQDVPAEVTLTGTEITLEAAANTRYTAGELTSLDLTPPASGMIDIVFVSGSTATTLTLPDWVVMPDGFEVEANTRVEINILDGYGVAQSWAVSA